MEKSLDRAADCKAAPQAQEIRGCDAHDACRSRPQDPGLELEGIAISHPNSCRSHDGAARLFVGRRRGHGKTYTGRVLRSGLSAGLWRGPEKLPQCRSGSRIRSGLPGLDPAAEHASQADRCIDLHRGLVDRRRSPASGSLGWWRHSGGEAHSSLRLGAARDTRAQTSDPTRSSSKALACSSCCGL